MNNRKYTFGHYFHPETCLTSMPMENIEFIGQSLPYFDSVRNEVCKNLAGKELPLEKVSFKEFESVHEQKYLNQIRKLIKGDQTDYPEISLECTNLHMAIPGYEYGLGGLYTALNLMRKGVLDRAYCFCLPSHHAFPQKGHGYCLLNSEAAAAKYARSIGFNKILIVDWDIHHGDGTQTIFENDNSVFCISIHSAVDLYMSMVGSTLLGTTSYGLKVGHCNIPVLDENYTTDFFYQDLEMTGEFYRSETCINQFKKEVDKLPFSPDLIIIFDGHDSHINDSGSYTTKFDYDDFRELIKIIKQVSKKNSCPILSMPGGGYDLDITVRCSLLHVEELSKT